MRRSQPAGVNRRAFLRTTGAAVGTAALLPLLDFGRVADAGAMSSPSVVDPDQLFTAGMFEQADRGYAELLRHDPGNVHALAQRGYIALLSNRFRDSERFLTGALDLAPQDTFSRRQLADCFVRQDELARAVPLLRQTGTDADSAAADQYAAITGPPWQIRGAESTRAPIVAIDPLPMVEISANGGPPFPCIFDTGATTLTLAQQVAGELGLRPVSSTTLLSGDGQVLTQFFGVLESLRIGEIEVRNLPVSWGNGSRPTPPDGPIPLGTMGSVLFYHFLTTLDYAGRGLVLRRKTEASGHKFEAAARRAGDRPLPLWLAATHLPCTLGSLNDLGPRVVSMDTGGSGSGVATTEAIAQEAGIAVDHEHPRQYRGMPHPAISPDRISLGDAVGRHVPGVVLNQLAGSGPSGFRFQTIANFTHEFFKPFAVTFDYDRMNLYVTPSVPDGR